MVTRGDLLHVEQFAGKAFDFADYARLKGPADAGVRGFRGRWPASLAEKSAQSETGLLEPLPAGGGAPDRASGKREGIPARRTEEGISQF